MSLPTLPRTVQHDQLQNRPELVTWELGASPTCGADSPWKWLCGNDLRGEVLRDVVDCLGDAGVPRLRLDLQRQGPGKELDGIIGHATSRGLEVDLGGRATEQLTAGGLGRLDDAGLTRLVIRADSAASLERKAPLLLDAVRSGLKIQIETQIDEKNVGRLDELARGFASWGLRDWSVVYPTRADGWLPEPAAYEASLDELAGLVERDRLSLTATAAPGLRRVFAQRGMSPEEAGSQLPLNDGRGLLFISSCGNLFPSRQLQILCANVKIHDLVDIYRFHPVFRTLRDTAMLEGKCAACNFRELCGGCRARAHALGGRLSGADPLCAYPGKTKPARPTFP